MTGIFCKSLLAFNILVASMPLISGSQLSIKIRSGKKSITCCSILFDVTEVFISQPISSKIIVHNSKSSRLSSKINTFLPFSILMFSLILTIHLYNLQYLLFLTLHQYLHVTQPVPAYKQQPLTKDFG